MKKIAVCAILAGFFATFHAKADVWVWVDEQGHSHFASQQVDARYSLFYRAPMQTAASESAEAVAPAAPEVHPKLAEFFESSPRYRKIQPLLKEAAARYRVDYELLQALVATESGFDAAAVSPKGAIGLMQVMPDTARRFGVDSDRWLSIETKLADPKININLGTRYLRLLIDMFPGKLDLALASYNAGEGAVQRAGNKVPNYKETQNYVATVGELYAALKPVPVAQVRASNGRVKATYGEGYVLAGARDPYLLKAPGGAQAVALGGAAGRGNMVAPLQRPPEPDSRIAD
ncbi:lytic transglycosylase domain-containing protein [Rhodoferax sp.]|uniref:lytic transglycosylase domain-containing protein n=1 Tax=Rhodoferax sp. TaxID=50421 RepID=UPI002ACE39BC|nr:lytic transglycosylase domain-containing protein [Rhodoferax sp.]MDZ7921241.1 lytic transglycosylase domain-containing protein [Rhodoferax sp.]